MHVHDQNGFPSVSGFGKRVQIREVQAGVPLGKAEVRTGIMMRHGSVLLVRFALSVGLERDCTGCGDDVVLIAGPTADPNCAHDLAIPFQRNTARKNHDLAVV